MAISTLGAGLERICLPAAQAEIDYLILLQAPEAAPIGRAEALLEGRTDVTIVPCSDRGLSNSRNAGLRQAKGDLVLFSDDDVTLEVGGILALRAAFVADPALVLAAGWRAERLPAHPRRAQLTRFNSGRICAPEFMVRRKDTLSLGVWFDPDFGLGAPHGVGEDYIFITDLLRRGGKGLALPVVTGSHPHASTGEHWGDPVLLAARRAVLARVFGRWAGLVRIAYAFRHRARFATVAQMFSFCRPER